MIHDHSAGHIRFFQIHLGGDRNFCYLIGDPESGKAAAVDPGFEPERFHEIAETEGLTIERILITHGHTDHTDGTEKLKALTGAVVHASLYERDPDGPGYNTAIAVDPEGTLRARTRKIHIPAFPLYHEDHY